MSDGNEVKSLGEYGLYQQMAEQTIRRFKDLNVTKIITLSPHGYHALKNEYPLLGGDFQVYHYTQMMADRIKQISPEARKTPVKVTFHDPCYLGRHNKEYKAPRAVLRSLRGIQITEMERSKEDALCCGGGGGNFFTDLLGRGPDSPARARVREAAQTGAEIVTVACPHCAKMLDDALKTEGLDEKMRVMDLAELVRMP
jgi:Fe-S oxidoreductase